MHTGLKNILYREMISEDQSRGQVTQHKHIYTAKCQEQIIGEMNHRKRPLSQGLPNQKRHKGELEEHMKKLGGTANAMPTVEMVYEADRKAIEREIIG